MSAYEELRLRAIDAWCGAKTVDAGVEAVLAEVLRTLEVVTPEMVDAYWGGPDKAKPEKITRPLAVKAWLDMLRASSLQPPARP